MSFFNGLLGGVSNPAQNSLGVGVAPNPALANHTGAHNMGMAGAMPINPYAYQQGRQNTYNDKHWSIDIVKTEDGFRLAVSHKGESKEFIARDPKELADKVLSAMVLSKITGKQNDTTQAATSSY